MKLKKTVTKQIGDRVIIRHHQTLRQNFSYQSAEVSYGVEFEVPNIGKKVEDGIKRAEAIVEDALSGKFEQQQELLRSIAGTINAVESESKKRR